MPEKDSSYIEVICPKRDIKNIGRIERGVAAEGGVIDSDDAWEVDRASLCDCPLGPQPRTLLGKDISWLLGQKCGERMTE